MTTGTQVLANAYVAFFGGPGSAISDAHWASGPTLAELQTLNNYTAGVQAAGSTFNVAASNVVEDRSWADQAGAKARGLANASGNVEPYTPGKGDTTSIYAQSHDFFTVPRTVLAIAQRFCVPDAQAIAAGDEINVFKVMTDGRSFKKTDASRTVAVDMVLQDGFVLNYIVPASTPVAVTVAPSGALAVTMGTAKFLKVSYQGRNVTTGAQYASSNEAIFKVTNSGIVVPVAVGTANLTVNLPGAASGSPIAVTVS